VQFIGGHACIVTEMQVTGIKVWVLADAVTAYCYNFDVYIGKNAEVVKNNLGLSSKVVIELTKPLEMKGYQVYTSYHHLGCGS
jgi:hypothetical protein